MMWDVVIFVVVVFGMSVYWMVSSLSQRGLFRTLLGMLNGVVAVMTFGYFCASKALDLHAQTIVSTDSDDDNGPIAKNPYRNLKGSDDPIEHGTWEIHERIRLRGY